MARLDVIPRFSLGQAWQAWKHPSRQVTWPFPGHPYAFNFLCAGLDFLWGYLKETGQLKHLQVVLPAFTCPTVVETTLRQGLKPLLVDVDLDDFNIHASSLKGVDLRKIDAILPTHIFGFPCDIPALKKQFTGIAGLTYPQGQVKFLSLQTDSQIAGL